MISGIKRMEIHDGDGLRTTVFFKGCPLGCIWCHNPESISYSKELAFFEDKCIGCGICKGENERRKDLAAAAVCPTEALKLYGDEYDVDTLFSLVIKDAPFFKQSGGGVTLSGGECLTYADFVTELSARLYAEGISVNIDTCGYVPRKVIDRVLPFTDTFLYDIKP